MKENTVDTTEKKKSNKRMFTGRVVSNKMQKTIVVEVTNRKLHRLYKKYVTTTKKLKAHDENNDSKIGDVVRIIESRPLSKTKSWKLVEIIERAK
ncbi:MAG: 30S ribosomal protein S17 [Spirochaetales bacterium]|nr:30S ribosomal protein S17 [Spirochaetales bacterium]